MSAPSVISFHEQVLADCEEMLELAEWFEKRTSNDTHGKWLRSVAIRYETISGAYNTASRTLAERSLRYNEEDVAELLEESRRCVEGTGEISDPRSCVAKMRGSE